VEAQVLISNERESELSARQTVQDSDTFMTLITPFVRQVNN